MDFAEFSRFVERERTVGKDKHNLGGRMAAFVSLVVGGQPRPT